MRRAEAEAERLVDPLVTIVTPSYNQGRFIRATIESVLSQDYPHIEYIIMDGGSTDETASVAKDYASRLTWISERDCGQSHAINKGFRIARGSVIAWLNSDDIILPGAICKAVRGFAKNRGAGAVYGEGYSIDRQGNRTARFPHTEPFNLWRLVYLSDYILQQTVYFRREVIEEIGYLREDLHYAMDWDLLIRIGKRYPLHYIPEYMGCLREHTEAKSFSGGGKRIKEIAGVLREHTGLQYPPGYVVYGLETYRKIWAEYVELRIPSPLRRVSVFLQHLIDVACRYWITRTLQRSQGWYPDSWAGPEVKYMLPRGTGGILVLCGWVPSFHLRPQRVTITDDGVQIAERKFDPGDFKWRVPLPAISGNEFLNLTFKASRSFIPGLRRRRVDVRRLAYILRSVTVKPLDQLETEEPDPEPSSQGWYSDSWAGPKVKYVLPRGTGGILILCGSIPGFRLRRQRVTIASEGVQIAQRTFVPGEFKWCVPLPATSGNKPLNLTFKASRTFIPRLRGRSTDVRRLAYLLRSVSVEPLIQLAMEEPDTELAKIAQPRR